MLGRIRSRLHGPHIRLPRPLDALSERWSRLRPRVRALAVAGVVAAVVGGGDLYLRSVQSRWGGPPVRVVVADRFLAVGESATDVRTVAVPPALVPSAAVAPGATDGVLAVAAPAGTVLTRAHFDVRGPAAGLAAGMRAVPVPTEPGWGVAEGGWVDVWTLGAGGSPSTRVARARPVLDVIDDASGTTSLVGLSDAEVEAVTAGLAMGRVLLAHAPPPARR